MGENNFSFIDSPRIIVCYFAGSVKGRQATIIKATVDALVASLFYVYQSQVNIGEKSMKKGFTLIELLVVVLIIGILSAIALPQYTLAVEKSRMSEALLFMGAMKRSVDMHIMENGYQTALWMGKEGDPVLEGMEGLIPSSAENEDFDGYRSKNFRYQADCFNNTWCQIEIYRMHDPNNPQGEYEYKVFSEKYPNTNKWQNRCEFNTAYPYSIKLCKGLYAQGWTE